MTDLNLRALERAAATDPEAAGQLAAEQARAGLVEARDHAADEAATLAALREIDMHEDLERRAAPWADGSGAQVYGRLVGYDDGQDRWLAWGDAYVAAVEQLAGQTGGEGTTYDALCDAIHGHVLWSQIGSACYRDARELVATEGLTDREAEDLADYLGWDLTDGLTADADGEWVDDAAGWTWVPSDEAAEQIAAAEDPEAEALRICREEPMRGRWIS